jgi:uncharacterized phage protein gp47/JayE
MDYGLTSFGFNMKRGDAILSDIKSRLAIKFPNIDLSDDSVNTQMTGIFADPFTKLWELANAVYNSQYPNSAEGQSLDYLCELNAITRLKQTPSVSILAAKGTEGTQITVYFKVGVVNKQNVIFEATENVTITVAKTNKMIVSVTTVTSSVDYVVVINSHTVKINSGVGATAITIAKAIHDEINAITDLLEVQALLPAVQDGTFTILSNDTNFSFNAVPDSKFTITSFWTPVRTQCLTVGAISANAGEITNIITPVAGLESVTNLKDAQEGREIEKDGQMRLRRYRNVRVIGAATVEAIRARLLQQVENVKQALVYENVEDYVVLGRPPKSIECLVAGGNDADIAAKIWETKAGGIETYGNQSYTIYDSTNKPQVIKFSRPINVYIWMRITLTTTTNFPADGRDQIINGILELAVNNFGIGADVLIQTFYCPIYSVEGVTNALVEIAKTYDFTPPVSYVTTNIAIGEDEASSFDSSRINLII